MFLRSAEDLDHLRDLTFWYSNNKIETQPVRLTWNFHIFLCGDIEIIGEGDTEITFQEDTLIADSNNDFSLNKIPCISISGKFWVEISLSEYPHGHIFKIPKQFINQFSWLNRQFSNQIANKFTKHFWIDCLDIKNDN